MGRGSSTPEALRDAHIKEQTPQNFTTEPNVCHSAVKLRWFESKRHLVNRLNTRMAVKQLLNDPSARRCSAPLFHFSSAAGGADNLEQPREEKEDFQHVRHKEDYSAAVEEAPKNLKACEVLTSSEDKVGGGDMNTAAPAVHVPPPGLRAAAPSGVHISGRGLLLPDG